MAIIISKKGKNAQKINTSRIEQEDYLQNYIYENPDSLPLYEIKEGARFLIIAREFPTNSGPIDALGIDEEGDIYLIETKLYKNPDKRLVVAQVLDYGAAHWQSSIDFSDFQRILDGKTREHFNMSLTQKLEDFFSFDEDEALNLLDSVRSNLEDGNYKFVILMDKLHGKLKDLIIFMNKNTKFDIYAVELEFYKFEDYEVLIPKVFGSQVKKDLTVRGSRGKVWTEEEFFDGAESSVGDPEIISIIREINQFAKEKSSLEPWRLERPPTKHGTFNFHVAYRDGDHSIFYVSMRGYIYFFLQQKDDLKKGLQDIGLRIPEKVKEKLIELDVFKEEVSLEDLKKVIEDYQSRAASISYKNL